MDSISNSSDLDDLLYRTQVAIQVHKNKKYAEKWSTENRANGFSLIMKGKTKQTLP